MTDTAEMHLGVAANRRVRWFSRGAASAVATKLDIIAHPGGCVATCRTGAEHEDNDRFQADCEAWFGMPVTVLQSEKYADTWDVWERRKFMAGPNGAPCTVELKLAPRLLFQRPDDIHVFGYTWDAPDIARAKRLRETFFEIQIETPLIDKELDKAACLALLEDAGVAPPLTYALGLPNANCIPCSRASSPDYWSLIRREFPEKFARAAALSRRLGARLTRINNVRIFIDEIPADWPVTAAVAPSCDFLCHLAKGDLE